ncbi:uncharacterized protein MONOS_1805 [Monocercomonoides exilis]|uniref:uncharacterized protein n=1 Tax=Monocercomonoides exilis TaxID=2049356 RepID=UPI00355A70EF|nr:hypothetical protein MONOS_1805 [Monocercomonoides exilis]|eukprot:MONOS_1805.1-p1 / transcript=MONOS_1805.1 / gene=MONOS_1805 / organism=Monocercomonoides_exilis_PA203 / gene_product=unspecified product / transcript_product=unspecified product / location=Mono_scaffold00034:29159-37769(-) / protein_length=2154 / sequence_SO=supercontig / SO=protein_coding / is_pseudo=false
MQLLVVCLEFVIGAFGSCQLPDKNEEQLQCWMGMLKGRQNRNEECVVKTMCRMHNSSIGLENVCIYRSREKCSFFVGEQSALSFGCCLLTEKGNLSSSTICNWGFCILRNTSLMSRSCCFLTNSVVEMQKASSCVQIENCEWRNIAFCGKGSILRNGEGFSEVVKKCTFANVTEMNKADEKMKSEDSITESHMEDSIVMSSMNVLEGGIVSGTQGSGVFLCSNCTFYHNERRDWRIRNIDRLSTTETQTFKNAEWIECSADCGGALYVHDNPNATLTVENSSFVKCKATSTRGGGIYALNIGECTVKHSVFEECYCASSTDYGGAGAEVEELNVQVLFENCMFRNCLSQNDAGGLFIGTSKASKTNDCVLDYKEGGGISLMVRSFSGNGLRYYDGEDKSEWLPNNGGKCRFVSSKLTQSKAKDTYSCGLNESYACLTISHCLSQLIVGFVEEMKVLSGTVVEGKGVDIGEKTICLSGVSPSGSAIETKFEANGLSLFCVGAGELAVNDLFVVHNTSIENNRRSRLFEIQGRGLMDVKRMNISMDVAHSEERSIQNSLVKVDGGELKMKDVKWLQTFSITSVISLSQGSSVSFSLDNCTFSNIVRTTAGSSLISASEGPFSITLEGCTIDGCGSVDSVFGGGMMIEVGNVGSLRMNGGFVKNCYASTTQGRGGGIGLKVKDTSADFLISSTFEGNRAKWGSDIFVDSIDLGTTATSGKITSLTASNSTINKIRGFHNGDETIPIPLCVYLIYLPEEIVASNVDAFDHSYCGYAEFPCLTLKHSLTRQEEEKKIVVDGMIAMEEELIFDSYKHSIRGNDENSGWKVIDECDGSGEGMITVNTNMNLRTLIFSIPSALPNHEIFFSSTSQSFSLEDCSLTFQGSQSALSYVFLSTTAGEVSVSSLNVLHLTIGNFPLINLDESNAAGTFTSMNIEDISSTGNGVLFGACDVSDQKEGAQSGFIANAVPVSVTGIVFSLKRSLTFHESVFECCLGKLTLSKCGMEGGAEAISTVFVKAVGGIVEVIGFGCERGAKWGSSLFVVEGNAESVSSMNMAKSDFGEITFGDGCVVECHNGIINEMSGCSFSSIARSQGSGGCVSVSNNKDDEDRRDFKVEINDCSFEGCTITGEEGNEIGGGALFCEASSKTSLVVSGCKFYCCTAPYGEGSVGYGGGIMLNLLSEMGETDFVISSPTFSSDKPNNARFGKDLFVSSPSLISSIKNETLPFVKDRLEMLTEDSLRGYDGGNKECAIPLIYFWKGIGTNVVVARGGNNVVVCGLLEYPCGSVDYGVKRGSDSGIESIVVQGICDVRSEMSVSGMRLEGTDGESDKIQFVKEIEGNGNVVVECRGVVQFKEVGMMIPTVFDNGARTLIQSGFDAIKTSIVGCSFHMKDDAEGELSFVLISASKGIVSIEKTNIAGFSTTHEIMSISADCVITMGNVTFEDISLSGKSAIVTRESVISGRGNDDAEEVWNILFDKCTFMNVKHSVSNNPSLLCCDAPNEVRLKMDNSTIDGCGSASSHEGGGVFFLLNEKGRLEMNHTNVTDCFCSNIGRGGGLFLKTQSVAKKTLPFVLSNITFRGNVASKGRDVFVKCTDLDTQISEWQFLINFGEPFVKELAIWGCTADNYEDGFVSEAEAVGMVPSRNLSSIPDETEVSVMIVYGKRLSATDAFVLKNRSEPKANGDERVAEGGKEGKSYWLLIVIVMSIILLIVLIGFILFIVRWKKVKNEAEDLREIVNDNIRKDPKAFEMVTMEMLPEEQWRRAEREAEKKSDERIKKRVYVKSLGHSESSEHLLSESGSTEYILGRDSDKIPQWMLEKEEEEEIRKRTPSPSISSTSTTSTTDSDSTFVRGEDLCPTTSSMSNLVDAMACSSPHEKLIVDLRDSLFMLLHGRNEKKEMAIGTLKEREQTAAQVLFWVANLALHSFSEMDNPLQSLVNLSPHIVLFSEHMVICIVMHSDFSSDDDSDSSSISSSTVATSASNDDDEEEEDSLPSSAFEDEDDNKKECLRWKAPELQMNKKMGATEKSVAFSIGMMLWECLTLQIPFGEYEAEAAGQKIVNGEVPNVGLVKDTPYLEFWRLCVSWNEADRPSLSGMKRELVGHFPAGAVMVTLTDAICDSLREDEEEEKEEEEEEEEEEDGMSESISKEEGRKSRKYL